MTNHNQFYVFLASQDQWSLREAINVVVYHIRSRWSGDEDQLYQEEKKLRDRYQHRIVEKLDVFSDSIRYEDASIDAIISGDHYAQVNPPVDQDNTLINTKRFVRWALSENIPLPKELIDNITEKAQPRKLEQVSVKNMVVEPLYEDIISDETIQKLKDLPLPQMKQQVAILAAEKKKNDAAIIACAKIGLLFYEFGLAKPANEKLFVAEYSKQSKELIDLPESVIKRLYKHLPDGYRRRSDGGRIASRTELDCIIKAAVFAGYLEGTQEDVDDKKLVSSLRDEGYLVPDEPELEKILEAMIKLR